MAATKRRHRDLRCDGLTPAPRGEAPYGVAVYRAGAFTPDKSVQLGKYVRRGGDQSITESCVAWAYAGAIWTLLGFLGLPPVWASVLHLYYLTRLLTAGGRKNLVWDGGCRMADAAEVLRGTGFAPDKVWPFRTIKVDAEPPWDVLVKGLKNNWIQPKRILATGAELESIIKRHLSATGGMARPVIRGIRVDQQYLDWLPGDPAWKLRGAVKGRHAELCATYDSEGLGKVASWGDIFDRKESWAQVRDDMDAETWVIDIDLEALKHNLRLMGLMR